MNRLEVGIATECSVSPILFVLAMQLLLKATENNADIAELDGGCQLPPVKPFMDDTTILTSKESTTRKKLSLVDEQIMKFKTKSLEISLLRKEKRIKV